MKKAVIILFSSLFLCAICQNIEAAGPSSYEASSLAEKKHHKRNKAPGQTGPRGVTGPPWLYISSGFTTAYATASLAPTDNENTYNLGRPSQPVKVPLNVGGLISSNASFDTTTHDFTLPSGIYEVYFHFTLDDNDVMVTSLFLQANATQIPLSWISGFYKDDNTKSAEGNGTDSADYTNYSGKTLISIPFDNTPVSLYIKTNNKDDLKFMDPLVKNNNSPCRVVFHKIADVS